MTEEAVAEAPGQTTGAEEADTGIMTVEDLAATFVERVESEGESDAAEPEAEGETPEADAEEESAGEDVLSQSESEDEEAEGEPEGGNEEPKAVSKLLKQVNRLTARSKAAEETVEAMKAEVTALKATPATESAQEPALEEVATFEDLDKVRKEAVAAKKWAMSHIGKEFVEEGEKEYSGDEIRQILTAADEHLTEKIPARAEFLKAKAESDYRSREVFDFWEQPEDESYQLYQQILADPRYASLESLPNRDFVMGLIVEGFRSVNAKVEAKNGKPKAKRTAKAPPSTMEDSVAPPIDTKEVRQRKKREAKLGKGVVSQSQLAAYLSE